MNVGLNSWLVVLFLFQAGTAAGSDAAPSPVDETKARPIVLPVQKTIGQALQQVFLPLIYEANPGLKDRTTKLQPGEQVVTPFFRKGMVVELERQVAELKKQLTDLQKIAGPLVAKNTELTIQVERSERLLRERTTYLIALEKKNRQWMMGAMVGALLAILFGGWLWLKRNETKENSSLRQKVKELTDAVAEEHRARIYWDKAAVQAAVLGVLKDHGIIVPTIDGGCLWPEPRPEITGPMVRAMLNRADQKMGDGGQGKSNVINFRERKR